MLPKILLCFLSDFSISAVYKAAGFSKIRLHCRHHVGLLKALEVKVVTTHLGNLILDLLIILNVQLLGPVRVCELLRGQKGGPMGAHSPVRRAEVGLRLCIDCDGLEGIWRTCEVDLVIGLMTW